MKGGIERHEKSTKEPQDCTLWPTDCKEKGKVIPSLSHNNGCGFPVLKDDYIMTHYQFSTDSFPWCRELQILQQSHSFRYSVDVL